MTKILVSCSALDAVELCKKIESLPTVHTAIIVRNAAEKYPEDRYLCTNYTTGAAISRFERLTALVN